MDRHYIIMPWPEIQDWMEEPDFKDHSYLMNDDRGVEEYGSSTYFVDVLWMTERQNYYKMIEDYVVQLINRGQVLVPDEYRKDFLDACERHNESPLEASLIGPGNKPCPNVKAYFSV